MIFFGKPVSTFPDHALVKFFSVAGITKAAGLFKEGLLGLASGGAELLPIFRISSESLDRRQLSDTPFHRTPDTHCRQEVRSLYNARREQAAYRSFKPQSCGRFSSLPPTHRGSCRADLTLWAPRCAPARSKPH